MAEYSTLSPEDARFVLERFGLQADTLVRLPGGAANSSYVVTTPAGRYVVTLLDNHDELSACVMSRLTAQLVASGIPTPEVLGADRDDHGVVLVAGTPAIVRPFVEGVQPATLNTVQLQEVGSTLARLHQLRLSAETPMRKRQLPDAWEAELGCRPDGRLVGAVRRGKADFERSIDRGACTVVLCHGDLFPDNMIWGPDGLVVLDWETASMDCAVLDIGITAVACCRDGDSVDWSRVRTLVDGYTAIRPLSDAETLALRPATRYAALILAYQRFLRHNVRYPNPQRTDHYKELLELALHID